MQRTKYVQNTYVIYKYLYFFFVFFLFSFLDRVSVFIHAYSAYLRKAFSFKASSSLACCHRSTIICQHRTKIVYKLQHWQQQQQLKRLLSLFSFFSLPTFISNKTYKKLSCRRDTARRPMSREISIRVTQGHWK